MRFGLAYHRPPKRKTCGCRSNSSARIASKLVEHTQKNRALPRVKCTHCGKEFSTQWAAKPEDIGLPRSGGRQRQFELPRKFCNKLWNAARFTMLNLAGYTPGDVPTTTWTIEDRWILSRLATVTSR